jgi:hypothetical protein
MPTPLTPRSSPSPAFAGLGQIPFASPCAGRLFPSELSSFVPNKFQKKQLRNSNEKASRLGLLPGSFGKPYHPVR